MTTKVKLVNVRLSFPDLFEAKEYKPGDGKPRYSAAFIIAPGSENDKAIRAAILAEAKTTWEKKGESTLKAIENNPNKFCYMSGDLKEYDGYAGNMILSSHRKASSGRPLVIDQQKNPLVVEDGKPYAGCYVNATVEIYGQKGENFGMRCGLLAVQFAGDGDAFSAGTKPSTDDFDDISADKELTEDLV